MPAPFSMSAYLVRRPYAPLLTDRTRPPTVLAAPGQPPVVTTIKTVTTQAKLARLTPHRFSAKLKPPTVVVASAPPVPVSTLLRVVSLQAVSRSRNPRPFSEIRFTSPAVVALQTTPPVIATIRLIQQAINRSNTY